jgi:predicted secreted protein
MGPWWGIWGRCSSGKKDRKKSDRRERGCKEKEERRKGRVAKAMPRKNKDWHIIIPLSSWLTLKNTHTTSDESERDRCNNVLYVRGAPEDDMDS